MYASVNHATVVAVIPSRLVGAKPLPEPLLFGQLAPEGQISVNIKSNSYTFFQENAFHNAVC